MLSLLKLLHALCDQMNHLSCRVFVCERTGPDSRSECSSMSRLPPSESRDTSPAPSSTPTRSRGDGDRQWDYDHAERSDTSSISSFEELDLESDRTGRCDHTPPSLTGRGKNNLRDQEKEIMVEEE